MLYISTLELPYGTFNVLLFVKRYFLFKPIKKLLKKIQFNFICRYLLFQFFLISSLLIILKILINTLQNTIDLVYLLKTNNCSIFGSFLNFPVWILKIFKKFVLVFVVLQSYLKKTSSFLCKVQGARGI